MKVDINLANCFGIEKMITRLDFDKRKAIAIYSKNGTMKTSLAKTFECIQKDNFNDIKDIIFDIKGKVDIKIDERQIRPEQVFVIKSFEQKYESTKLVNLLVSDDIRNITSELLSKKQSLLKNISKLSGVKPIDVEPKILMDFSTSGSKLTSLINDLPKLPKHSSLDSNLEIKYEDVFEKTLESFIRSDSFQKDINHYLNASRQVYREFIFLEEDNFDLLKFRDLAKLLEESEYFKPKNGINLNTRKEITNTKDLQMLINEIDDKL